MTSLLRRFYLVLVYRLSWIVFAATGVALALFCTPMLLLPHRERYGSFIRSVIRHLFSGWIHWQHFTGVVAVRFIGFESPLTSGTVFIANHPTLVDATFLLAHLPDTICIFKPSLMRNPATGPAALMAGYVSGDTGVELIKTVAAKLKTGHSILIFPEGTRTQPGTVLGPLKPGFAIIAARAHAPVQLVIVRATPELARRGRSWWTPPAILPACVEFTLDRRWLPNSQQTAAAFTAEVDAHIRSVLGSTTA